MLQRRCLLQLPRQQTRDADPLRPLPGSRDGLLAPPAEAEAANSCLAEQLHLQALLCRTRSLCLHLRAQLQLFETTAAGGRRPKKRNATAAFLDVHRRIPPDSEPRGQVGAHRRDQGALPHRREEIPRSHQPVEAGRIQPLPQRKRRLPDDGLCQDGHGRQRPRLCLAGPGPEAPQLQAPVDHLQHLKEKRTAGRSRETAAGLCSQRKKQCRCLATALTFVFRGRTDSQGPEHHRLPVEVFPGRHHQSRKFGQWQCCGRQRLLPGDPQHRHQLLRATELPHGPEVPQRIHRPETQ